MKILISTENESKEEVEQLINYLEKNWWKTSKISTEETNAIRDIIDFVIIKRISKNATDLDYTRLLTLKSKLYPH